MSFASRFATHEVLNQPPPLEHVNLFDQDCALAEAATREGADPTRLAGFGTWLGTPEAIDLGAQANRHPPELRSHDRFGRRIDEVAFHPAWHALMGRAIAERVHNLPWAEPGPGAHVTRAAAAFLLNQVESGVCCPMAMTFAAVPALQDAPALVTDWLPKSLSADYDDACAPLAAKRGAVVGMAMTEKQGGSGVRANSTRAHPIGEGLFELVGHKWFCSAPMSDAFLTLAQTERGWRRLRRPRPRPPRWRPPGCGASCRLSACRSWS
jgi:putative acyl-CoA dehydrogenase